MINYINFNGKNTIFNEMINYINFNGNAIFLLSFFMDNCN